MANSVTLATRGLGVEAEVFFQIEKEIATVSGRTDRIKNALSKLGGKWDGDARVWRMPASRIAELVIACEEKRIAAAKVSCAEKSKGMELF